MESQRLSNFMSFLALKPDFLSENYRKILPQVEFLLESGLKLILLKNTETRGYLQKQLENRTVMLTS